MKLVSIRLDTTPESTENLLAIRPRYLNTVRKAAIDALERGPRIGGQIIDTQIILHHLHIGRGTVDSFLIAVTTQCIQKVNQFHLIKSTQIYNYCIINRYF